MDDAIAWNVFELTGSVEDYMRFKRISETIDGKNEDIYEIEEINVDKVNVYDNETKDKMI